MKLTNTLTGKKEELQTLEPGIIKMYVCGITPYSDSHLGHARVYVTFDVLYRLLQFLGYQVTYVRNFTDIDDKLLDRAEQELGNRMHYLEIANRYIQAYEEEMELLGNMRPTHEPRVTETIPEIIELIEGLIAKGKAYQADGDVYYSISSFGDYGKLSKQKLDELRAGARVELNELKRDPLDFALWKSEPEGSFWPSPWGYGRPGWHIECSAMARKFLGDQIDIHGGGADLAFPHHENEKAQTEGFTGKPFATYWVHNAFVTVNKEKMSKSLGNFFALKDIFLQAHPIAVRYYILSHHYKAPLDFSLQDLEAAQKSYQRLAHFFVDHPCTQVVHRDMIDKSKIAQQMLQFLTDDLNTPGMFGVVFENLKALIHNPQELCAVKEVLRLVLGLPLELLPQKQIEITPEIERLLKEREQARAARDFKRADEIRAQLAQLGIEVQDKRAS